MAEAAAIAGALGALLLVPAWSRGALLIGLALVLAALVGLGFVGGEARALATVGTLFDSPLGIAALVLVALLVVAGAAALVLWPSVTVPLLLALEFLRLPIASDPDSPVLLGIVGNGGLGRPYPFAAALAAATLALAWRAIRGERLERVPRVLAIPAAAFLALNIVSFLWARDPAAATNALIFEWLPFVVVFAVAAHSPITARTPRTLAVTLLGIAAVLAGVGIWQAATEQLFFYNAALERANAIRPIFRVTAAFQDPNYLGRYLVMAIGVALAAAWVGRAQPALALGLVAFLGAALWFTYSQSSLVALVIVALGLAVAAGDRLARRVALGAGALLAVAGAVALAIGLAGGSAESFTSDRSTLVANTAAVAASYPIVGVGVASQPLVTRDEEQPGTTKDENVSHTGPLTVAAELGIVGVVSLLALAAGVVRLLMTLNRRNPGLALGIAAPLATIFVHSLFYPGLFEQAMLWGALGVAAAAVAQGHTASPPSRVR